MFHYPENILKVVIGNTGTVEEEDALGKKLRRIIRLIKFLPGFLVRRIAKRGLMKIIESPEPQKCLIFTLLDRLFATKVYDKPDALCHFKNLLDFRINYPLNAENMRDISKRLLVVESEEDKGVAPHAKAALRRIFPEARYYLFKEGGHTPSLSKTEEYAKLITEFLGAS